MSLIAGYTGAVKIGGSTVTNCGEWSGDFGPNLVKTTSFGATGGWDTHEPTTKSGQGTFSVNVDEDPSHSTLRNAALNGTKVTLNLYDSAITYYSGDAFLKLKASSKADADLSKMQFDFTCTGPWAYN